LSDLDTGVLRNYADYLERRFNRLEVKELRAPDRRREQQMEKYLNELDAVLKLIDRIESEAA
jgi:predicted glycosyl hydrolase (DUF1957 family)